MAWVSSNQIDPSAAGKTTAVSDVISSVFSSEDPRFLSIDVQGGLTNFRLEGRVGGGAWRTIKTQAAGARLVFTGPFETTPDLLDDQLRIVALAVANVDSVWVTKTY